MTDAFVLGCTKRLGQDQKQGLSGKLDAETTTG